VSTAAIALARAAGLRVWATSRSDDKRKRAVELGAHEVFATGERLPERVDVVLESVGEATWSHSLRSLRPGGRIVVCGATTGPNPSADLGRVFFTQLDIVGSTMGNREELRRLADFLVVTGIRPVVDEVVPLRRARHAFGRLAEGEVFGKVVLTP
jgi:NADPH:quinone reductase-like Zn-dependent oxidoreductase